MMTTALYERLADFIEIMDEDELRGLAVICQAKAEIKADERRDCQRIELMEKLQQTLSAIKDAKFELTIDNVSNPSWCVKITPNDTYSITMR